MSSPEIPASDGGTLLQSIADRVLVERATGVLMYLLRLDPTRRRPSCTGGRLKRESSWTRWRQPRQRNLPARPPACERAAPAAAAAREPACASGPPTARTDLAALIGHTLCPWQQRRCRASAGPRCWRSGGARTSSTRLRSPAVPPTSPCSTSACRTPVPEARVGTRPARCAQARRGGARAGLDHSRGSAPVPPRRPGDGRDRHRAAVRGRRGEAHLRRQQAAQDAGIPALEALTTVARAERSLVTEPMVKGELSAG
jgi:hypothetical protein